MLHAPLLGRYCVTLDGKTTSAYGTSAATPVLAGIVARLNEIRLAHGKPPMGFLNPFLYGSAGVVLGRVRVCSVVVAPCPLLAALIAVPNVLQRQW